ncbi:MAG: DUF5011 domain-containing protein [Cellvibrionaceae bacterium]|nr:DUF5011 domain-containing protein [Cellvibrionaceae bacterium]
MNQYSILNRKKACFNFLTVFFLLFPIFLGFSSLSQALTPGEPDGNGQLSWRDLSGVTVQDDGTITKTSEILWQQGFFDSYDILPANTDGWIEIDINDEMEYIDIGLSEYDIPRPTRSRRHIKHGFWLHSRHHSSLIGQLQVYESLVENSLTNVGLYNSGDTLRIERVGSEIRYLLNGSLVHISPLITTDALRVEIFMHTQGMNMPAPRMSASFSYAQDDSGWTPCADEGGSCLASVPALVRYGVADNYTLAYTESPETFTCDGTAFGNVVVDGAAHCEIKYYANQDYDRDGVADNIDPQPDVSALIVQPVWRDLTGVVVNSDNSITKTGTVAWQEGFFDSVQTLPANTDGWIEVVINDEMEYIDIGLSEHDIPRPTRSRRHIKHGFWLHSRHNSSLIGQLQVYEPLAGNSLTNVGLYNSGDILRIERVGSEMRYLLNDSLVHTSPLTTTAELRVEIFMQIQGMTMSPPALFFAFSDDHDGDGIVNNEDVFPNDPTESLDSDGDGLGDNTDPFPNDPTNGAAAIELTLIGDEAIELAWGEAYVELGATAVDANNTDVSNTIEITSNYVANTAGTYTVSYTVPAGTSGLPAALSITRTIIVNEQVFETAIDLVGEALITLDFGTEYLELGATATDSRGADISDFIVTSSNYDNTQAGTYTVRYSLPAGTDGLLEALDVVRTVIVNPPETGVSLSLIGAAHIELTSNETYIEYGATAVDSNNNDISHLIVIDSNYDADKLGVSTVNYSLPAGTDDLLEPLVVTRTVRNSPAHCPDHCTQGCIQLAANAMQCAVDVVDSVRLNDAIRIDESQNDCLAPCGVHFLAEVTGDFQADSNFHHLAYHWDFGDEGSYFRSLDEDFPFTNDANRAQGSKAGHVFEEPGEYHVVLRVAAKNGRFAETTKTIRVLDPADHFTPEQTICLSSSARFEGCPEGAAQLTQWEAAVDKITADNLARNGSYVLLRAGDSFNTVERLLLREGRHVFTRYGDGEDPIINVRDNLSIFFTMDVAELSASYLRLQGDYNSQTGLGDAYRSRGFFIGITSTENVTYNTTVYRMAMSGLGICLYAQNGVGAVFADNHCTNWQDYGSLHGIERTAFVGNSLKQDLNAQGGPDTKLFSITIYPDDNEGREGGDGITRAFVYDFNLAGDHDLGIRIINSDGTRIHMSDEQGYSLDLASSTVTFDAAPENGATVEIFHRRWADHGAIRSSNSRSLVLSQNDLFNNVGWFGNGAHHNPALRYNTRGYAGHSGVIVENRIKGGTMAAVFEPANSNLTAGAGEVMVERNLFVGTEPTYYGLRVNYGNITMRNNIIAQPNVLPTANTYSRGIFFSENYREGKEQDPDNFAGPVEVYNNTIVNLAYDNRGRDGNIVFAFVFEGIYLDEHHSGIGDAFSDFTEKNNLIYAPLTRNVDYNIDPGFDNNYLPSAATSAEDSTLPGLFDTFWGDQRSSSPSTGAVE